MQGLGFRLQEETVLKTLTLDVLKSSEWRRTIKSRTGTFFGCKTFGIEIAGAVPAERNVEGVVEMLLDATQRYDEPLSDDRLFGWHAALSNWTKWNA
jgi:hypothetical protein